MSNSDKKILFTDLDDTLLTSSKQVSSIDRQSLDKVISAGHKIVITTGRPLYSAKLLAHELGFNKPGFYLIASNGGVVYDYTHEKAIVKHTVPFEVVNTIFAAARRHGIHVHTYTDEFVVTTKLTEELQYYCERIRMPYKILDSIPEDLPEAPPKVICITLKGRGALESLRQELSEYTKDKLNVVFSSDLLLEFLPIPATKGNAIKEVCKILDIPLSNSIACGDQENDISMLKAAHIGVAVANAIPEAKENADYVTKATNDENAITEVINKFILN